MSSCSNYALHVKRGAIYNNHGFYSSELCNVRQRQTEKGETTGYAHRVKSVTSCPLNFIMQLRYVKSKILSMYPWNQITNHKLVIIHQIVTSNHRVSRRYSNTC